MDAQSKEVNVNVGGGFAGLLALLFIGLKLSGHIDWSWWWVLAPLWLPFAIVLAFAASVLAVICLAAVFGTVTVKSK